MNNELTSKMKNILTVDVEDYFQVENFSDKIPRAAWHKYKMRVERNTQWFVDLFEEKKVKATFFVLGWIAERYPEMVRRVHDAGHEVASHGYDHRLVYDQHPSEFREDVRKAKSILEDIIGAPVLGYRAPTFSLIKENMCAFGILEEEGYVYDASVFPGTRDKGGIPEASRLPHTIKIGKKMLWEIPSSTIAFKGKRFPFGGGGYFRLAPYALTRWAMRRLNAEGKPIIVYIHPWEIDNKQPRIIVSPVKRFRHYVNVGKNTKHKFRQLLDDFEFVRVVDYIEAQSS